MMRLDFTDPMFEQLKQIAEGHNETHSSDLLGKEVTLMLYHAGLVWPARGNLFWLTLLE